MSLTLSKVTLLGVVTKEITTKTVNNNYMATSDIGTESSYIKLSGDLKSDMNYHTVQCWGKQAELFEQMAQIGSVVYLEGQLRYYIKEWSGRKFKTPVINVSVIRILTKLKKKANEVMEDG